MPRPTSARLAELSRLIAVPAWREDPGSRETHTVPEPFTGQPLGEVPIGTASDVEDAFARARRAQVAWAARPLADRAAVLRRFGDLVFAHRDELLDLVQAESGKNRLSALDEVLDVMLNARFYAERGPGWLKEKRIGGMIPGLTKSKVMYVPRGVVGVIAPWNYPLSLSMTDALAAIMAGNGIVMKPATQTPFTALLGLELLQAAGLPEGLWQIVPGSGGVVGTAIVERCDYLMFTGSSATGAELGGRIGARLIPFSAELGGKNPMIVGEGVDLAKVCEIGVRACFASAGQLCMSVERIFVVRSVYDAFCEAFAKRVSAIKLGAGYGWDAEMGCIVSPEQLDVIAGHVEDAVAKGARILAGGRRRPDLGPTFFEPTLLADVPESADCYAAETFGPVASVYPVDSLDEAIERANASAYGLCSSVFCATDAEGEAVASRLNTGMANVNEGYAPAWSSLEGPSGGMGISGVGYRHGVEGLRKYTHARTIAVQSRALHLGGPSFLKGAVWPKALTQGTNLMKYLPGR